MISQEEDNPILQFISRPKPLQTGEPQKKQSAFPLENNPLDSLSSSNDEPTIPTVLNSRITNNRDRLHKLGRSLPELFSTPLYQSHPQLNRATNESFCELAINLKARSQSQPKREAVQEVQTNELEFESRFECGNLALVARNSEPNSYVLCLQKDINTSGSSTQWFFFRVRNNSLIGTYSFHIVNLTKPYSSYTDGMRPVVCTGKGFQRGCTDIDYRRNTLVRDESELNSYYTLSFTYEFKRQGEVAYFSHSFPYSYTKLQNYLARLEKGYSHMFHKRKIGMTALGNSIECVTITNPQSNKIKPVVFISCRAHPGETPCSYILEGIVNSLLGVRKQSEHMRNELVFKIIPMLNPDGVVHGNYRTSLNGVDLNRFWSEQNKQYPEVLAAKSVIKESNGTKLAFFDLHGHSKKKGVFAYGCMNRINPFVTKQLPYLMHKVVKDFNYYSCNFVVEECREGTARVAVWRQFGIAHSYTIETSFLGPDKEKTSYTIKDYHRIGGEIVEAIYQYFCRKRFGIPSDVTQIIEQLYRDKQLLKVGENHSEGSSASQDQEEGLKQFSAILEPSPKKIVQISPEPKRMISPQRINLRRTRIGLKKPRMMATQLETKVTQINLNRTSDEEQRTIPLLISIGERFGKTSDIRENSWRYPMEQQINFKQCSTVHKLSMMGPKTVVQQSKQRNCYVSFRKFKTSTSVERPPSEGATQPARVDRHGITFSVEMSRNRLFI